ncbi:hypothetical protein D047_3152 [Vibrio parahaemolyticus VPTS-2010_2]|nr:hypothetical protein D047_3152 [Vibrio parahaemolyticus VPTS-2010_2]
MGYMLFKWEGEGQVPPGSFRLPLFIRWGFPVYKGDQESE